MHSAPSAKSVVILSLFVFLMIEGCVTKGRYQAQLSESQTLADRLQKEQNKGAELEKNIADLKKRVETLEGELAEAKETAAIKEKGLSDRVAVLEQQLALAKDMGSKNEMELKSELVRMKGEFEEANRSQQSALANLQEELEKKNRELSELQVALKATEEEAARKARELQESTKAHKDLIGKLEKEINEGSVKISQLKDRLSVEIVDKILFASGSDQITGGGKEVLKKVSDILKGVKENTIRIEGHTDNVPIGAKLKDLFASNWELSTSRATQVVRFLVESGVEPENLLAVGGSAYHPVASNDTPEGRQRNRRIEIVLFPKDIQKIVETVK